MHTPRLSSLHITAICIINAHQHFEFSIGNDEIMQKLPLKSVIFIRKVPFILHIAVCTSIPPRLGYRMAAAAPAGS